MHKNIKNLAGKRFGKLTVISENGRSKCGQVKWLCRCDCGKERNIISSSLISGKTKSCGCIRNEVYNPKDYKHGLGRTRIYQEFLHMHNRCEKQYKNHKNYYDRGITVCKEWERTDDGLKTFVEWAYENGYNENLTLDRIDNDRGYAPNNCRWATAREQANNRRTNIRITRNGETKTLKEWCDYLGLNYKTVYRRYRIVGWDIERALTEPIQ